MTGGSFSVARLDGHPIVHKGLFSGPGGDNINGPSAIATSAWMQPRLGNFYCYFAHHKGDHIRLAYADSLAGPWTLHEGGVLSLSAVAQCFDHIASPDVHVDEANKRIVMFFHGPSRAAKEQLTFRAISHNGLDFVVEELPVATFYFRAVPWRNRWIGMGRSGEMYLGDSLYGKFVPLGRQVFSEGDFAGGIRHVALTIEGESLFAFFSRIGDCPERILVAELDLRVSQTEWQFRGLSEVMSPQLPWEGTDLPLRPSIVGLALKLEHELRDPAILRLDDKLFLIYCGGGESAIGIASLQYDTEDAK